MIGMNFISFLILLIISVVVSGILHYGFKCYATPGFESFCVKVVVGCNLIDNINAGSESARAHFGDPKVPQGVGRSINQLPKNPLAFFRLERQNSSAGNRTSSNVRRKYLVRPLSFGGATLFAARLLSAKGPAESALPPLADSCRTATKRRFVPDSYSAANSIFIRAPRQRLRVASADL